MRRSSPLVPHQQLIFDLVQTRASLLIDRAWMLQNQGIFLKMVPTHEINQER